MNQPTSTQIKEFIDSLVTVFKHFFEHVTNWVTEISWMKFFIFAMIVMIIGAITNDTIFKDEEQVVIGKAPHSASNKNDADRDTDIEINSSGIHIKKNKNITPPVVPTPPEPDEALDAPDAPPAPNTAGKSSNGATPSSAKKSELSDDEIHVQLPPGVSDDISNAINDEIADANAHDKVTYRKEKSTWLMSLVMISLLGLFGIKALMGGKRRAELKAQSAQQDAERESLQRQVAEAKMQMMQAQIEPHFLFNTLASVEHLIETDPPRASAMQRSLIQYLRAVIPQMRENTSNTNL